MKFCDIRKRENRMFKTITAPQQAKNVAFQKGKNRKQRPDAATIPKMIAMRVR